MSSSTHTVNIARPTDGEFQASRVAAIEALRAAGDRTEAARVYDERVFPAERERIRRAAEALNEPVLDILFVTVGAQSNAPLLAVVASPAAHVVLLHTEKEKRIADELVSRLRLRADQASLRSIGDGRNPSILYRVTLDEWERRGRPVRVAFDLTGGLKPMSAAAALAGFALPGARVFYADQDQETIHGQLFHLNQRRTELQNPLTVFGVLQRRTAQELLAAAKYGPAAVAYEDLVRHCNEPPDIFRAGLSRGYEALEGLDFGNAAVILETLVTRLDRALQTSLELAHDLVVAQRAHIAANAEGARRLERFIGQVPPANEDPTHDLRALQSPECLDFIAMLLAAAGRTEKAQPDISALLAYRAMEAMPQRRLALLGLDPGNLDWAAAAMLRKSTVASLVDAYNQASGDARHHLSIEALPTQVARAQAYVLLRVLAPEDVAGTMAVQRFSGLGAARNKSLLAHGVQQLAAKDVRSILTAAQELFDRLCAVEQISDSDRLKLVARHCLLQLPSK